MKCNEISIRKVVEVLTFRVGSEGMTIQLDESSDSNIIGAHVKKNTGIKTVAD